MAYYTQGQGLISQRRGNASYFYHYDGLGSTKALTDANQNIQASYKYDAWGNTLQASGTITNPYLYVGELGYYSDGDAGMYLLTQRWYNPILERFVLRDPSARIGSFYSYSGYLPTRYIDPKGLYNIEKSCAEYAKAIKTALNMLARQLRWGCLSGTPLEGEENEIIERLTDTIHIGCGGFWCWCLNLRGVDYAYTSIITKNRIQLCGPAFTGRGAKRDVIPGLPFIILHEVCHIFGTNNDDLCNQIASKCFPGNWKGL